MKSKVVKIAFLTSLLSFSNAFAAELGSKVDGWVVSTSNIENNSAYIAGDKIYTTNQDNSKISSESLGSPSIIIKNEKEFQSLVNEYNNLPEYRRKGVINVYLQLDLDEFKP